MSPRILNLFRVVEGKRVGYRFVIDAQDVIIEEAVVDVQDQPLSPRELRMQQLGITYERREDGGITITGVPPREQLISRFFVDSSPCWFPGCEELRRQFKEEVGKLGSDCPACDRGALMNKYRDQIDEILPK